jgi:hypothetical protein
VVIQNDSPGTFGSAGGVVLDGLTVINDHPRNWLTTYVDPSTRLQSIAGTVKVVTRQEFAGIACAVNPGKPSDDKDLVAVTVTCASSGGTAAAAAAAAAPADSILGGEQ